MSYWLRRIALVVAAAVALSGCGILSGFLALLPQMSEHGLPLNLELVGYGDGRYSDRPPAMITDDAYMEGFEDGRRTRQAWERYYLSGPHGGGAGAGGGGGGF